MDFSFSEEQQMLREQAGSFLAQRAGHERIAEIAGSEEGWDPVLWRELAELGWTGLSVPEDAGGAGMGFLEEAVVFEEAGKACLPAPLFSTVGLALPALAQEPELLGPVLAGARAATVAWIEGDTRAPLDGPGPYSTKAVGDGGGWELTGEKRLVTELHAARDVVVVADDGGDVALFHVDASDAAVELHETADRTRRLGTLRLESTRARPLAQGDDAARLLRTIRLRALAALALEGVGVAQTALDLAKAYVSERKQFDRAIGSYQAVSHQVADMYVETELARSLAYWAAWCVAEDDPQAPVAVAAAKAAAAQAAVGACERSIQVHGGIGFTWEHVLHRFYKRAQWIEAFDSSPAGLRREVAATILS